MTSNPARYLSLLALMCVFPPADAPAQTAARNGRIACSERITGGTSSQIILYEPDGSNPRFLTQSGYNTYPSWSRDGRRILYSSNTGAGVQEIWVMDADGSNKRQITFGTPGGNFTPVESPDGSRIVFTSMRPGSAVAPEVWVMNSDGSDQRRLTITERPPNLEYAWSLHPAWSADGRKIAYASTKSGSTQIWVMHADGSDQRQLTNGLGANYPDANVPHWSYDGSSITFWSGFERQYGEVWVMNADGSNPRKVTETPDPMNSDDPHWAPDGRQIVYATGRGGIRAMYVIDVDGRNDRKFAEGVHWCDWQPIPLDAPGSAGPMFAHMAVGEGYTTQFTLVNTSVQSVAGDLLFTDSMGSPMNVSVLDGVTAPAAAISTQSFHPLALAPGATQTVTASAPASSSGPPRSGWALASVTGGGVSGVATFRREENGALQTAAAVLSSPPVSAATIPVDNDGAASRFTGFAVANPGGGDLRLRLVVVREDGTIAETILAPELTLAPYGHAARFLHELRPALVRFRGSIVLVAEGGGKFVATALQLDRGRLTAIPVVEGRAPHIR